MSDSDGSLTYAYDNMGRVTSDTQVITGLTPSVVLASVYDANSNRTSLATTVGSNADFKNEYLYDNLNRMTRVTQQSQSGGNAVATKRVDFAYNALGQPVATGRLLGSAGGTGKIGRMAVKRVLRGSSLGREILHTLTSAAKHRGDDRILLNAQRSAEGFYQRAGFTPLGEPFDEVDIPHVQMVKLL